MPIVKSISTPNGAAVAFHKALRASCDLSSGAVSIDVASWVSEDAYLSGSGIVWSWPVLAQLAAIADIDSALALIAPFDGGTVVADDAESLDAVKLRQWATLKDARDATIRSGFTWDSSKFDSDDESQQRIQGAVQLAVLAAAAGQPFSIDWTLFDNSTRTLSGSDMIGVGQALGAFVAAAFATGVTLRDQVNNATSVEAVRQVAWPTA